MTADALPGLFEQLSSFSPALGKMKRFRNPVFAVELQSLLDFPARYILVVSPLSLTFNTFACHNVFRPDYYHAGQRYPKPHPRLAPLPRQSGSFVSLRTRVSHLFFPSPSTTIKQPPSKSPRRETKENQSRRQVGRHAHRLAIRVPRQPTRGRAAQPGQQGSSLCLFVSQPATTII